MLSRVADAIYWMSRYLERAENTARFLEANWHLTLDLPEQDDAAALWRPLINVTGDEQSFTQRHGDPGKEKVIEFLTFDTVYSNSIRNCLRAARENARTVREMIPSEVWERINVFYHLVEEAAKSPSRVLDNPYQLCDEIKLRNQTISGIVYDTMTHDEAWHFFRLGRLLERADKTSRIVDVKYFILLPNLGDVGTALDYVQWAALLKATSGLEAYRHRYGRILPGRVVEFLFLDHDFPRSVLYCLTAAQHSLHHITGTRIGYFSNLAEKRLGQALANLSFHTIDEIFDEGLHEFTDNLQKQMNAVDAAVFETFLGTFEPVDSAQEQ